MCGGFCSSMLLHGPTGQPHSGLRLACPTETPGATLALPQGIPSCPPGRFLPPGRAFQGSQGVVPVSAQGVSASSPASPPGLLLPQPWDPCPFDPDLGAAPPLILGDGLPLPPQQGDHPSPETMDYCHLTLTPVLQPLCDSQERPLYPFPKWFLPPSL